METSLLTQVIDILAPAAFGLLLALVSWALAELTRYVRSRTQSEAVNGAIARVCHMTETTVAEINQLMVDNLRAAAADGKIDRAEIAALRDSAILRVKQQLTPQVLDLARQGVADLNEFIGARVERAVREQKIEGDA